MAEIRSPLIIDSHCHAWAYWPYEPPVPDPESRGTVEQLLNQMDLNGVNQACIVSANIWHNPENNDYVARAVREHPTRLYQFADVDSFWSSTYHKPGAAGRLDGAAEKWHMKGFTHYLASEDDGSWLTSRAGTDFFKVAEEHRLIASIACQPHQQSALRKVAEKFPSVPILCHHMGLVKSSEPSPHRNLNEVLRSAELPNMYLKLSGFAYVSQRSWDYPFSDALWVYRVAYERFGRRTVWGSDYPVCAFDMTHRQALEAFRTHCTFVTDSDKEAILGGTLYMLLHGAKEVA